VAKSLNLVCVNNSYLKVSDVVATSVTQFNGIHVIREVVALITAHTSPYQEAI
jgi:hypothetical protein